MLAVLRRQTGTTREILNEQGSSNSAQGRNSSAKIVAGTPIDRIGTVVCFVLIKSERSTARHKKMQRFQHPMLFADWATRASTMYLMLPTHLQGEMTTVCGLETIGEDWGRIFQWYIFMGLETFSPNQNNF